MARGRPPKGAELVDGLESSTQAKERLKIILQTIAGELSVIDACASLNISEARFHELRSETLHAAAAHLEPKPVGRRPQQADAQAAETAALKEQIQELKIDLRAAQIREELALLMPHVLKPRTQQPLDRRQRLDAMQQDEEKKGASTYHTLPYNDVKDSTPPGSCESGKSST
jgi:hypothetical protein